MRFSPNNPNITRKRTKCNVQPGLPITTSTYETSDDQIPSTSGVTKKQANKKRKHVDSDVESDADSDLHSNVLDRDKSGEKHSESTSYQPKRSKASDSDFMPRTSDFVLVNVPTKSGGCKVHLAQITNVTMNLDSQETFFDVSYLKCIQGSNKRKFVSNPSDVDVLQANAFIPMTLEVPSLNPRGQYVFSKALEMVA